MGDIYVTNRNSYWNGYWCDNKMKQKDLNKAMYEKGQEFGRKERETEIIEIIYKEIIEEEKSMELNRKWNIIRELQYLIKQIKEKKTKERYLCPYCNKDYAYGFNVEGGDYFCKSCGKYFNIYDKYKRKRFITTNELIKQIDKYKFKQ